MYLSSQNWPGENTTKKSSVKSTCNPIKELWFQFFSTTMVSTHIVSKIEQEFLYITTSEFSTNKVFMGTQKNYLT